MQESSSHLTNGCRKHKDHPVLKGFCVPVDEKFIMLYLNLINDGSWTPVSGGVPQAREER
jgi:hypothetical protein